MSSTTRMVFGYPTYMNALAPPINGDIAYLSPSLVIGTEVAAYPLTNIYNSNPARPFKANETTIQIRWDLGNARAVKRLALIHHNLDAALAGITVKAGSTTGVSDYTSSAVVIPNPDDDGYTVSPFIDLTAAGSYRYWRLNIDTANSLPVILGEVCLQLDDRQVPHNFIYGLTQGEMNDLIRHQTYQGVQLVYDKGNRIKALRGTVQTTPAALSTYQQWRRAVRGQPHLLIPNPSVNEALYGRFESNDGPFTFTDFGVRTWPFSWVEVSRGLPWSQV